MNRLALIYHSAHGHTEHIARAPDELVEYDGFIFGSPTYLGGVSGPFKSVMDSTGRLWRAEQLEGKLAAGFTVSSLPAGDKQSTLLSMFVFSMQHGMPPRA